MSSNIASRSDGEGGEDRHVSTKAEPNGAVREPNVNYLNLLRQGFSVLWD